MCTIHMVQEVGEPLKCIRSMRVLDFPSTRASRYYCENPKCWSQIALTPVPCGEKAFFSALPSDRDHSSKNDVSSIRKG